MIANIIFFIAGLGIGAIAAIVGAVCYLFLPMGSLTKA